MKTFPSSLLPENISSFSVYELKRKICYMRKYIYECMISSTFNIPNNCGINMQNISPQEEYGVDSRVTDQICADLRERGWETAVGYGGTILFVYTPGSQPVQSISCVGGFE